MLRHSTFVLISPLMYVYADSAAVRLIFLDCHATYSTSFVLLYDKVINMLACALTNIWRTHKSVHHDTVVTKTIIALATNE